LHLLPRLCPLCLDDTITGHGRRLRQAHDDRHDRIWVRRGICRPCGKTFTVLPNWLAPSGHFSVPCRQQACERIAAGASVEQSAPHCKDPSRSPDSSRMARKFDSCITPPINGERKLRNTPIRRRSDSARLRSPQSGRSFRIVPGASCVEGACARAFFSTALAGELVPQAQSAGHWPTP
jgi:hypothetical protein